MRWLGGITDSMDMSLRKTPRVGHGQGGLPCCSPLGLKMMDTAELLNLTGLISPNICELLKGRRERVLFLTLYLQNLE